MSYGEKYGWKVGEDYPEWADIPEYLDTIGRGYLLEGETPKKAYQRVCKAVSKRLKKPHLASKFFEYIWNGWLCLSSPVLANTGTKRGLPISCYAIHVDDDMNDIGMKNRELMMLTKHGGGVGIGVGDIRPAGSPIRNNGTTDGVVPFCKMYDSSLLATNQGSTRRGAGSLNLPIEHGDYEEFLNIKKPLGDVQRQCMNLQQCVTVTDEFMQKLLKGDKKARRLWVKTLQTRKETGMPYILFEDNINKKNPESYKNNNLKVKNTNICCLTGDTLVLTTEGPKRIDSLLGKNVKIYNGKNWESCSNFNKIKDVDVIYEIELKNGSIMKATDDHRWFVAKNYEDIRRNKYKEVTTLDLEVGDFLECHREENHGNKELVGAYLKGLVYRKEELISYASCYKEKLPQEWKEWNKKSKLLFLSGLLDADGTYDKSIQISSVKKNFLLDLQEMLSSLGVVSSLDVNNSRPVYRLSISSFDSWHLYPQLSCKRIVRKGKEPNRILTGFRKVKSITKVLLEKPEPVYCPNIPSTGKFGLNNGIVTGNCEIVLYTDKDHSFVCCVASVNLAKRNEWRDTDLIRHSIYFLDGIMEEFLQRAKKLKGFENAVRFAKKGRPLGLGVLGWHTYLQQKGIPFESLEATLHTRMIFGDMKNKANEASRELAEEFGEPEWCKGTGMRNTHLMAVAPTTSNAKLAGGISPSIEPWSANVFTEQTCKGTFIRKNPTLKKLLREIGMDKKEVWDFILYDNGSVKDLTFLDDYCFLEGEVLKKESVSDEDLYKIYEIKDVFKTFREINQLQLVKQAAVRQKYIDQAQSLNLAFYKDTSPKEINKIHLEAWKLGIKTLYYMRTESSLRGDVMSKNDLKDCFWCEG